MWQKHLARVVCVHLEHLEHFDLDACPITDHSPARTEREASHHTAGDAAAGESDGKHSLSRHTH